MKLHFSLYAAGVAASLTVASIAYGQAYPNRPVRIVAAEIGGSSDFAARIVAQGLTANLAQQVVIENRGGSSVIALEAVAKAKPDGQTLLVFGNSLWVLPLIQDIPFEPLRDFVPITLVTRSPNILVVHPSLPVKNVKELIVLARARPGQLNYASGVSGSSNHVAAELFKAASNVNIVRVPYKGASPALIDLVSGQVQMMFATAGSVAPHLQAKRLRALGISSARPSPVLPGLPTIASEGLPGYQSETIISMWAPAGTPVAIVKRLNQEVTQVVHRPEEQKRFLASGVEGATSTQEELAALVKAEVTKLRNVLKSTDVKTQ